MTGKIIIISLLYVFAFDPLDCLVSHHAFQGRCEFNFTNGDWEEFNIHVPKIHACIKKFPHCELLVQLNNYSLPAFPNGTFLNLKRNLSLKLEITDSRIQLLSPLLPDYSIFQNSVFHSVIFDISDSSTLSGWQWGALHDLNLAPGKGLVLNVVRSKLVHLHSDFNKVASGRLTAVRILKCRLRWLGRQVFAPLQYLKTLELRDNFLENVERSQLPTFAKELKALDFGNNRLSNLPHDIFDGLNLNYVYLDGNNLKISEPLAQTILNGHHLFASGVILPCNCDNFLKWVEKIGENGVKQQPCYTDHNSEEVFMYWNVCPT